MLTCQLWWKFKSWSWFASSGFVWYVFHLFYVSCWNVTCLVSMSREIALNYPVVTFTISVSNCLVMLLLCAQLNSMKWNYLCEHLSLPSLWTLPQSRKHQMCNIQLCLKWVLWQQLDGVQSNKQHVMIDGRQRKNASYDYWIKWMKQFINVTPNLVLAMIQIIFHLCHLST